MVVPPFKAKIGCRLDDRLCSGFISVRGGDRRSERDQDRGVAACAVAPPREKSNLNSHFRESWLSAAADFQFLAASVARRAKYLLEPGFSKAAWTTLPELSTVTRTATLICPRIV